MEYRVSELAEKAGVTKRTIHYYISKGLLMPPNGEGINSTYDDRHLERLKKKGETFDVSHLGVVSWETAIEYGEVVVWNKLYKRSLLTSLPERKHFSALLWQEICR